MTGNQTGQFSRNNQGPVGIPGPNGVPLARRRRRALIDIHAIDAKARAHNAQLEEERLRLIQEDPETAAILEEEAAKQRKADEEAYQKAGAANSSDSLKNARKTIEGIDQASRGSRGAVEDEGDLNPSDLDDWTPPVAPTAPVSSQAPEEDKPDLSAAPEATSKPEEGPAAKPARKRARKTTTTTIQT